MKKKYTKDYSTKTADEWFSLKKWKGFLLTIPLGRVVTKECDSVRDVLAIRSTAGALSGQNDECDRRFSVMTGIDNERVINVTATKK